MSQSDPTIFRDIWKTLSCIDCSKHVEKKNNLSYLSWAWAWGILMEHYPASSYDFDPPTVLDNGTCEQWMTLTVSDGSRWARRSMWLPYLNYQNKPITNPTSWDVNTTRMRLLAKSCAMFGLGHYIYAGEDVPNGSTPEVEEQPSGEPVLTDEYAVILADLESAADEGNDAFKDAWKCTDRETRDAIGVARFQALKKRAENAAA